MLFQKKKKLKEYQSTDDTDKLRLFISDTVHISKNCGLDLDDAYSFV